MAEILGLGVSHGPIILTPPEVWHQGRERIYNRVPNYEKPAQLLEELGQDNGLSQDKADHQRIVFLSSCYDFPFDTTRSLEFALFRTFCTANDQSLRAVREFCRSVAKG